MDENVQKHVKIGQKRPIRSPYGEFPSLLLSFMRILSIFDDLTARM